MPYVRRCELGDHDPVTPLKLYWCCERCRETYRKNVNEIAAQAEISRRAAESRRVLASYRRVPYFALLLCFAGWLVTQLLT